MKTTSLLIVTTIAAAALQLAPLSQAGEREGWGKRHGGRWANLTMEERQKLRDANQKVMADPALQAAKDRMRQAAKEFRDLKRARMLQVDPTLQPILDKMQQQRGGQKDS